MLTKLAKSITFLEFVGPIPLIFIGILRILNPILVTIAIGMAILPWVTRRFILRHSPHRTYIDTALIIFVISTFIGLSASYDSTLSWPVTLTLLGSVSLFYVIVNTRLSPWLITKGLVLIASIFAFYFVTQYGYFYYPLEAGYLAYLARLTSSLFPNCVFFTPHPNAAASFMEGSFLLGLVLIWQSRGLKRWGWLSASSLLAYGLLISDSRGAWLGLAGVLAIWGVLLIPFRPLRFILVATIVGIGLLGGYIILKSSGNLPSLQTTVDSRFILYRNSLFLWSDYFFTGIGLGDPFAMVYSYYQLLILVPFLSYSHNLFLAVGVGNGVLGLVALLWLLFGFYRCVVQVEKAGLSNPVSNLFRASWLGGTVTFLHGLTDSPQFSGSGWSMPMMLGILGLSILLGYKAMTQAGSQSSNRVKRWRWQGLVIVLVLVFAVVTIFGRSLWSAWYANLGAIYQTQADLSPTLDESTRLRIINLAVTNFKYSLSLNPAQPTSNFRLGLIDLNLDNFNQAALYLERAYQQEPKNQGILKALGLAYLWIGRLDEAQNLLQQIDDQAELIEELNNWSKWRDSLGQTMLSYNAADMATRLSQTESK